MLLEIKKLTVKVEDKEILSDLDLKVNPGEVHVIMGRNGSGKSSFSKVLAGHPAYTVVSGEILYEINFKMKNLLDLSIEERAKEGVFLAMQHPIEIPGVSNFHFLQTSYNSILKHQGVEELSESDFRKLVLEKIKLVKMSESFLDRDVNVGFSGGEKKRNEILQMAVLSPRLCILDEPDSGLDIDSLRIVGEGIHHLRSKNNGIILITHYQRILDYIKPDYIHILHAGAIQQTGGPELALKLEEQGYDWIK